jgi:SAM-dependent methyltransferase
MEETAILNHPPADKVCAQEQSFLCARCRNVMSGRSCNCGFSVPIVDGIHDFIANDPVRESVRREIEEWDVIVTEYATCRLKQERVISVPTYFAGLGEHRSARHMLPALRDLDLRGKVGIEVGGTGHSLAFMMRSGCTRLFHLEVSKETQRIAMQNLAPLPEIDRTQICYLNAPAECIPLPDNSVDFLMAFGTYHHTDRRRSIPEVHRILKPGGMFYLHDPYIGTALLPAKWITRVLRKPLGFEPGNDNPLSRSDLSLLKRYFPIHRYEIRNVLDVAAFLVRCVSPALARRMYRQETDLPGITSLAVDFLKGVLLFSGQKTTTQS